MCHGTGMTASQDCVGCVSNDMWIQNFYRIKPNKLDNMLLLHEPGLGTREVFYHSATVIYQLPVNN